MPRPWISANFAVSADGKISDAAGGASGWTSAEDHQNLVRLRCGAEAIMVGRGTLERDRMRMVVPGAERQPLRCIVSRRGVVDPSQPVFSSPGGRILVLATEERAGMATHGGSVAGFLETLAAEHGVRRLHCEGGGMLLRELAALDVIDELHLTFAGHSVFGGARSATLTGIPGDFLPASRRFRLIAWEPRPDLGECFLLYRRQEDQCPEGAGSPCFP